MRKARLAGVLAVTVLVAGGTYALAGTSTAATCGAPKPGGEWRSYNKDLANSRHQPAENTITPANARSLRPAWVFNDAGKGSFNSTPSVADGCVFLGSSSGYVFALNADTGRQVWQFRVPDATDEIGSAPTVVGGRVYVSEFHTSAPYVLALDEATGALLWRTRIDSQFGSDTYSSPAVFNGMVMVGVSGASAEAGTTLCPKQVAAQFGCGGGPKSRLHFRGSYVLLSALTGQILKKSYVISDDDFKAGYAGGGVWSTAAVDLATQYAYIATGNPFNAREHPNTNAILKVDVNPSRPTFGAVVGTHHGTDELYVKGGTYKPVCAIYVDVFTCDPPDFDFGASPQLFTDSSGRRLVGDMQKSGVYHVARRDNMHGAWKRTVGGPIGQFGGEATASYDGRSLFTGGNAPGLLTALEPNGGHRRWVSPIADGFHFQSVSSAAGVIYTTDSRGFFDAWQASTGKPLLVRSLGADTGQTPYQEFSGGESVSIARHTVFVPAGGYVVAYRLG